MGETPHANSSRKGPHGSPNESFLRDKELEFFGKKRVGVRKGDHLSLQSVYGHKPKPNEGKPRTG